MAEAEELQTQEHPQSSTESSVLSTEKESDLVTQDSELSTQDSELRTDKKPGGDDPQAVRARKEYAARKRAEQELEAERIRIARLEGENQALRAQPKPAEEKVFTIAEINAAVERNEITRVDADRYIDQVIIPKRIDDRLKAREAEARQLQPLERAEADIEEYKRYLPFLRNKSDPQFLKVADQYRALLAEGHPANYVTEKLAVRLLHGDLSQVKRKAEIEAATRERGVTLMPVDPGSNGRAQNQNGKVDLSKAPAHLVRYWDRTGTDQKDREIEMGYWLKGQKK